MFEDLETHFAPVSYLIHLIYMEVHPESQKRAQGDCNFFLVTKKRFCKMRTKQDSFFCGEHSIFDESADRNTRIRCPYDTKQYSCGYYTNNIYSTVDVNLLEAHLKKCNGRPSEKPVFFSSCKNIAVPSTKSEDIYMSKLTMDIYHYMKSKTDEHIIGRSSSCDYSPKLKGLGHSFKHSIQNVRYL